MLNKVILIGNLGRDPEVRYFDNGVAKATFPIATSESYKNKSGERITQTEWHNIVVWRGLAEVVEKYVKKGDRIYIEGKIKTRSYDDKDGVKKYVTEIVTDNLQMLGGKPQNSNENQETQATPSSNEPDIIENNTSDDLPF